MRAAGYETLARIDKPKPGDVVLIWNRQGGSAEQADYFERCGAKVLVAENGYLGKHWRGQEWFALAVGHHSGAGVWPDRGPERWDSWGVELAPYRTGGRETVLFAQRGIGEIGYASPDHWAETTQRRIGGRIREHPGIGTSKPLAEDLADAKQVVTWHSGAALQAIMLGVPCWHDFPQWIGAGASRPLDEWPGEPKRDEAARLAMFRRLAHAIWTLDEIRTGEPIRCLMA